MFLMQKYTLRLVPVLLVASLFLPLATLGVAFSQDKSLNLIHKHTNETLHITFMRDGEYDRTALKKLNHFLRDWRNDETREMDPDLFNLLADVYKKLGASEPIHVVSSYRSPGSNAMLRRRSRGVARNSQHIQGRAMDFYIPGISTSQIREVALKMERGGVGFYPRAGTAFIHLDTGSVRMWPKMSRDQLARLFPDGKTVHIPRDGKPMGQFDVALANLKARGGSFSRGGGGEEEESGSGFFAALFGLSKNKPQELPREPIKETPRPVETEVVRPALPERQTVALATPTPAPVDETPKQLKIMPLVPKTKFIAPTPMAMPKFRDKLKTELALNTKIEPAKEDKNDAITLKTAPLPPTREKTDEIKVAAITPKMIPPPPQDLRVKSVSLPPAPPQDLRVKLASAPPPPQRLMPEVKTSEVKTVAEKPREEPKKLLTITMPSFTPSFSFVKPPENPYAFR